MNIFMNIFLNLKHFPFMLTSHPPALPFCRHWAAAGDTVQAWGCNLVHLREKKERIKNELASLKNSNIEITTSFYSFWADVTFYLCMYSPVQPNITISQWGRMTKPSFMASAAHLTAAALCFQTAQSWEYYFSSQFSERRILV